MTPTLGDFLTLAGQRIAAAGQHRGRLPSDGHAEAVAELGRLLTVMARYACDGLDPSAAAVTSLVPTRQELTIIGIRLTVLHAADSIHQVAQADGIPAGAGHPVAADLRAAADALLAGRDLVRTHDPATSHAGADPLWASALTARPVVAALMRELVGFAPHLAGLTVRLLRPVRGPAISLATRQALREAGKWLTLTASAYAGEHDQPGLDVSTLLLHNIPANLPPPRQPPATADLPAADLCAGATAAAARLRHLAHRPPGQPDWPSPAAAASWRHNALATAIITHNSELLLATLADRSGQLALPADHQNALQQSADAVRIAWQSWQTVARTWDPLTTGTSTRPSLIAAELDDVVLWIGRLARTGTWTPARAHAGQPRPPADLAPAPDDITIALVAIGRTTDAATEIARHDLRSAEHAAAAGRIYSPARLLPETDDLIHVYRYRHASPAQIADLRTAYQHAITATEHVTNTLDTLLTDLCTPGEPYALARALQRSPVAAQLRYQNARPPGSRATTDAQPGPGAGDIERLLHNLNVNDPQLLFRAIALDHATRDLTAEAMATVEQLARAHREAAGCHYSYSRNPSARLAAQDLPGAGSLALPSRAPIERAKPNSAGRVARDQPRTRKSPPTSPTR